MNRTSLVDLCSCFPIAVETFADELGLAPERDLTVTGSMAFAGGPFNNYVIHATCRIAKLLREGRGCHGLVSSVSGVLAKQGFGLGSRTPGRERFALRNVSGDVARAVRCEPVVESAAGRGTIAGCTVLYERDKPLRGVAIVDAGNARTVAGTLDASISHGWNRWRCAARRCSSATTIRSRSD